jgi:uncharacterized protein
MLTALLSRVLGRFDRYVFGGVPASASALPARDLPLPSVPVPASWVRAGAPTASALLLTRSPDGGLLTGVWECTPGRFRWYFACDEVIIVLHGRGRVRIGEVEHALEPGVTVFFPIGTDSEWEIDETLRKYFTHRFPTPLAQRVLSAAASRDRAT